MPFLRNVTRGRGIPEERLVEVSHHYQALGGASPINEQNRRCGRRCRPSCDRRGWALPVLWGNRNWAPYLADVVRAAHAGGQRRLLGLATSAYSSYSSCRQYREDFGLALQATGLVGSDPDRQGGAVLRPRRVRRRRSSTAPSTALRAAAGAGIAVAELEVVFTTHSIPTDDGGHLGVGRPRRPRPGGAYVAPAPGRRRGRVIASRRARRTRDRVARPGSWPTSPAPGRRRCRGWSRTSTTSSTDLAGGRPARGDRRADRVRVRPRRGDLGSGQRGRRDRRRSTACSSPGCATPGIDPRFVAALADAGAASAAGSAPGRRTAGRASTGLARPDFCAAGCCVNLRGAETDHRRGGFGRRLGRARRRRRPCWRRPASAGGAHAVTPRDRPAGAAGRHPGQRAGPRPVGAIAAAIDRDDRRAQRTRPDPDRGRRRTRAAGRDRRHRRVRHRGPGRAARRAGRRRSCTRSRTCRQRRSPGIAVAAVPAREDPSDALCARDGLTLATLPAGARVGTGSPRRAAQLLAPPAGSAGACRSAATSTPGCGWSPTAGWTPWCSPPPGWPGSAEPTPITELFGAGA